MIRMRALRNTPVIMKDKHMGFLQDIQLDDSQKLVSALIVSCGLSGRRIVPAQSILSLDAGFILVSHTVRCKQCILPVSSRFVRDAAGLLVGIVTDYVIDEKRLSVVALEMSTGYGFTTSTKRLWLFDYARSVYEPSELCIPSFVSRELIMAKEEN